MDAKEQSPNYCPTCKVFCVLPNHCDNCGGDLVYKSPESKEREQARESLDDCVKRTVPAPEWGTPQRYVTEFDEAKLVDRIAAAALEARDGSREERILLAEFLATKPTVKQIQLATSIAIERAERLSRPKDEVQSALDELREMFPDDWVRIDQSAMVNAFGDPWNLVTINVDRMKTDFEGHTLDTAMQKVRDWKEQQKERE